ncbi:unnamed protein product [Lymnaea stagnalis]|uniref:Lengsin n=1 Tax=Lymnaea stagnalis TaxID=6523 RepID=A0AAV2HQU3_LYMST
MEELVVEKHQKPIKWTVNDFNLLQLIFVDVNGIPRGKTVPKNVALHLANNGIEMLHLNQTLGLAMDVPWKVEELIDEFPNGIYIPDLETVVRWPWACQPELQIGQVMGHIVWEDGHRESLSVRFQAEKQIDKLKSLGLKVVSSFTIQFTVFKSAHKHCGDFMGGDNRLGIGPYDNISTELCMLDLCEQLKEAGVEVESWTSLPGRGQFEMTLLASEGIRSADAVCRFRHGLKSAMAKVGFQVTFMTHPPGVGAETFNSMVHRFAIYSTLGQNMFLDDTEGGKLSDVVKNWTAGMLSHAAAMTALCCPTVNCYSHDKTPRHLDWDVDNFSSYLNIHVHENEAWIENRMPTSACNPYFVILATVASGIDGLEKKMNCPEKCSTSFDIVPEDLGTALQILKVDNVLTDALSPVLMKVFLNIKEDYEIEKFRTLEDGPDRTDKLKQLEYEYYLSRL